MDKTTLLPTDYTYPVMRPWARSFSADANAKGGLKLQLLSQEGISKRKEIPHADFYQW